MKKFFITSAAVAGLIVTLPLTYFTYKYFEDRFPSEEDRLFTRTILEAFNGNITEVKPSEIFPEEWDFVCLPPEYKDVEFGLKWYFKEHLKKPNVEFFGNNIYFGEGRWGLVFVSLVENEANYVTKKYNRHLGGHVSYWGDKGYGFCAKRESAKFKVKFQFNNFFNSHISMEGSQK